MHSQTLNPTLSLLQHHHQRILVPHSFSLPPLFHSFTAASFSPLRKRNHGGTSPSSPFITASLSQIHGYGTMDYEKRVTKAWRLLYRRITLNEKSDGNIPEILKEWKGEGMRASKWDLRQIIKELRKYRKYKLALEVYDWMLNQTEVFVPSSSDIAIQLDLVFKVYGISTAEKLFSGLPDVTRNEKTYGALLNVLVQAKLKEKAEHLFEEMREKGYLWHALPFNSMLTLYMDSREHERVESLVEEMIDRNVRLDTYSYNIWITTCSDKGDVEKMEQVYMKMKEDTNVSINWTTYSTLAAMYAKLGLFEKAQHNLTELEARVTGRDRKPYDYLISLYGNIGKKDEVYRVWNIYKDKFAKMTNSAYYSMISSLLRLNDLVGAEAIYEEWESVKSGDDSRIYNCFVFTYVKEGKVNEAELFLKRVSETGSKPSPWTWEVLAEARIEEGEFHKALLALKSASLVPGLRWSPKPENVASLSQFFEKTGDTESSKALQEML